MCDYSLMAVPSRLAREGEELVTYRFLTHSIGLASAADIRAFNAWESDCAKAGMLARVKRLLVNNEPVVCAVCIPPGAKLRVKMNGEIKSATFDQLSKRVNSYRDAIRFEGGHTSLLQELPIGLRVTVESLEGATEREEVEEFAYVRAR